MEKQGNEKVYDLEERTAIFAENVRDFVLKLPKNKSNTEFGSQLIRSGSSPAANYIEANECLRGKDLRMKLKTCRREAKESGYWLRMVITESNEALELERIRLKQEAKELVYIFSAILNKLKEE